MTEDQAVELLLQTDGSMHSAAIRRLVRYLAALGLLKLEQPRP